MAEGHAQVRALPRLLPRGTRAPARAQRLRGDWLPRPALSWMSYSRLLNALFWIGNQYGVPGP